MAAISETSQKTTHARPRSPKTCARPWPGGGTAWCSPSGTAHLERLTAALQDAGHNPVVLRGGMGAKARTAALARLQPGPGQPPLLAVAHRVLHRGRLRLPALDTLFLAAPDLVQRAPRPVRRADPAPLPPAKPPPKSTTTTTPATAVLAASLAKRAAGYTSLGFPTPPAASPHTQFAAQPGKSLTHSLDNQCAIARKSRLAPLEPNHCSTTRDSHAPRNRQPLPALTASDRPNKERNRDVPHRERVIPDPLPQRIETRPNGPGLTCEFDGGRCWVRTNVG